MGGQGSLKESFNDFMTTMFVEETLALPKSPKKLEDHHQVCSFITSLFGEQPWTLPRYANLDVLYKKDFITIDKQN